MEEELNQNEDLNKVEVSTEAGSPDIIFSNDVVATIAGLAASDIPGVAGMSGGIVDGFTEILGKKNLSKGVKVEIRENVAVIDLYIIVDYGCRVPDIAWEIQNKVKKDVETMTGLKVENVNINVQGVRFDKNQKAEEE